MDVCLEEYGLRWARHHLGEQSSDRKEASQQTKICSACYDNMDFTMFIMRYRVIIEQDEDGFFVAGCPSLLGCVSQGSTRQEALDNIKEAIAG